MKLLYDIVYAPLPSISIEKATESTAGMRAVVTRGGSLDLGFHHTDPHRLKMTVEMYVSFNIKGGMAAFQGESLCLMMRTLGSSESDPGSKLLSGTRTLLESLRMRGVMWSMFVDKEGCLCWSMGGSPGKGGVKSTESTLRSSPGSVCLVDAVTSDGEEDRSACVWTHIVAVVDSSSNYEQESLQKGPSSASVTLFINSEKAASGSVQVPPLKESDLAAPGVLYVCPCVPAGSRVTELRVVRHSFILLCSSLPCFVLSCPVLLYEHLHDIFLSYYRYTKAASPYPVLYFPSILSDTATTDLSYFTCALCEHSLP